MDWSPHLDAGERVLWEGCPAPRCYTFRHWRRSLWPLAGVAAVPLLWLSVPQGFWRLFLSGAAAGAALCCSAGVFVSARLRWPTVFYAVSDRALLVSEGRFRNRLVRLPLAAIETVEVARHGPELATVRVGAQGGEGVTLCWLEHFRTPLALLQGDSGRVVAPR